MSTETIQKPKNEHGRKTITRENSERFFEWDRAVTVGRFVLLPAVLNVVGGWFYTTDKDPAEIWVTFIDNGDGTYSNLAEDLMTEEEKAEVEAAYEKIFNSGENKTEQGGYQISLA